MILRLWSAITWPFRAIAYTVEGAGRLAAGLVGFALMALGVAFVAGAYYLVGGALFLGGLILAFKPRG